MNFFSDDFQNWYQQQKVENRSFVCGFCDDKVASDRGYKIGKIGDGSGSQIGGIYICPNCHGPNFLTPGSDWYPGQNVGRNVKNIPTSLKQLYDESRRCAKEHCYTASVLLCRKMLMNIAVDQGAKENLAFVAYVNYLSDKGFVPPNGKKWVDHIRKKGNEATHEIHMMMFDDAKEILFFVEMLLIFLYEFPSMVQDK